jgi:hypothetical protein
MELPEPKVLEYLNKVFTAQRVARMVRIGSYDGIANKLIV